MNDVVEQIVLMPTGTQDENGQALKKEHTQIKKNFFIRTNQRKHFVVWLVLFVCLMIVAGPISVYISNRVPAMKSRKGVASTFSEERARDYLHNLTSYGSRVSGTRGNFDAHRFLVSQLHRICGTSKRNLHFELDLHNYTTSSHEQIRNILLRVSNPMTKSVNNLSTLMLTAHYDSVEFSSGASDDGSGVVILLELLSNVIHDMTVTFSNVNLLLLLTDGEEMGSEGAKAFRLDHRWRSNVRRFINVDSINSNEVASLTQIKPTQLIYKYRSIPRPRANVLLDYIPKWTGIGTDFNVFTLENSVIGYDFGSMLDGYRYHTPHDHISRIREGVIQELGENIGRLIRDTLSEDLEQTEHLNKNDSLIYFDFYGRYLFVYRSSPSIIVHRILLLFTIVGSLIIILLDHVLHQRRSLICDHYSCAYSSLKYSLFHRLLSIFIYFISNLLSIVMGMTFSILIYWLTWLIRPLSWYGNTTLAIFLFSLPCVIAFITVSYLWSLLHDCILKKSSRHSSANRVSSTFDLEKHLSVVLVYGVLMILTSYVNYRLFYSLFVWSIFLCPISLLWIVLDFSLHWKIVRWNLSKERFYWLYSPLLISVIPLTHTISIVNQLLRILIPFLVRRFARQWTLGAHLVICCVISIPTIFLSLIFIPVLQRTKYFGRVLILLSISFLVVLLITFTRQSFTINHPNIFYATHISKPFYKSSILSNGSSPPRLISRSSSITVLTFNSLPLSPVLKQFSNKINHRLENIRCFTPSICKFDDTFNRPNAIHNIQIKPLTNYTIVIQHVLSYSINVSSRSPVQIRQHQMNLPRTETTIDVAFSTALRSFDIDINIARCDIKDSPFLLLFTRTMPHMVLIGDGKCQSIEDEATLLVHLS